MKTNLINTALFVSAIALLTSCNPDSRRAEKEDNQDPKEVAKDENDTKFDDTEIEGDTKFAVKAADAGMLEVQLGELAQSKGVSKEVKDLGKMMVTEHSKANEELKALAQTKNISLPATLSDECRKKYQDLAEKSGADFDDAFTEAMVKDHKNAIDDFQKEADKGNDPDLKSWAAGKLATLEHHLDMSKSAEEAVDNNKKTGKL